MSQSSESNLAARELDPFAAMRRAEELGESVAVGLEKIEAFGQPDVVWPHPEVVAEIETSVPQSELPGSRPPANRSGLRSRAPENVWLDRMARLRSAIASLGAEAQGVVDGEQGLEIKLGVASIRLAEQKQRIDEAIGEAGRRIINRAEQVIESACVVGVEYKKPAREDGRSDTEYWVSLTPDNGLLVTEQVFPPSDESTLPRTRWTIEDRQLSSEGVRDNMTIVVEKRDGEDPVLKRAMSLAETRDTDPNVTVVASDGPFIHGPDVVDMQKAHEDDLSKAHEIAPRYCGGSSDGRDDFATQDAL